MKTRIYTIEFGRFFDCGKDGLYQECTNQASFINIDEANQELEKYYSECGLMFTEENTTNIDGYYVELYVYDYDLSKEEIDEINQTNYFSDGTSGKLINEIIIDKCGKIVNYETNNFLMRQ